MLPLPLILPVHSMSAVIPLAFLTRLVTRQPLIWGRIAPYLSKYCCVTQTCVVCVPPPVGSTTPAGNGACCHVVVVVNAHTPGFRVRAGAIPVIAKRQPTILIQRRFLHMFSPVCSRRHLPAHSPTSAMRARVGTLFYYIVRVDHFFPTVYATFELTLAKGSPHPVAIGAGGGGSRGRNLMAPRNDHVHD